jgi:hypothetical protein
MKTKNDLKTVTVTLSPFEFWYLAKTFGPGLAFGVMDPTENLSNEDLEKAEAGAVESLKKAGVIKSDSEDQIQMDELLGAMIYSSIHSNDVLVLKSRAIEKEQFYHFLPDWQMKFSQEGEDYQLTLFKNREDLLKDILFSNNFTSTGHFEERKFSILARELEMGVSLFELDQRDQAIKVIKSSVVGDLREPEEFLAAYSRSKPALSIKMIYNRNDKSIHECIYDLIQLSDDLYWLSHGTTPGDEPKPVIYFTAVTGSEVRNRVLGLLPRQK